MFIVGTVEAFKDLECEVVFHPSYHAPEEGQFALQVHGGETCRLSCFADVSFHIYALCRLTGQT